MPAIGDAILIQSGASGLHLFVVLNDPKPLMGYGGVNHCVLVNFSTIRAAVPHDPTCLLGGGIHPFVINPSYVYYRGVRVEREDHLDTCLAQNVFQLRPPPFSAAFVAQVVAGMNLSPTMKRTFRGILP